MDFRALKFDLLIAFSVELLTNTIVSTSRKKNIDMKFIEELYNCISQPLVHLSCGTVSVKLKEMRFSLLISEIKLSALIIFRDIEICSADHNSAMVLTCFVFHYLFL